MNAVSETLQKMLADPPNEMVYVMDFVQDFRRNPILESVSTLGAPSETPKEKLALLAAIIETLCLNARLPIPDWATSVEPLQTPYFVSGIESLKAITLVESPVPFRRRNIFVLKNFLTRV